MRVVRCKENNAYIKFMRDLKAFYSLFYSLFQQSFQHVICSIRGKLSDELISLINIIRFMR